MATTDGTDARILAGVVALSADRLMDELLTASNGRLFLRTR